MADEYEFYVQASMRGYRAYFVDATVHIGEVMDCAMEPENDRYARVHSVYVPRRRHAKSFEVVRQAAAEAPTPATSSPVPKLGSLLFPPQMRKRGEVTRTRKLMD